ncbi:MAG: ATP-binding protein [Spirochaetaceae bacterium]|nr:ATP-binding protein [Spirochaetaceae bacterium]
MKPDASAQNEPKTLFADAPARPPLSIRPYARLLTMLGEQLLKNERVALVELIKNSYDADASRVDVLFEGFSKNMTKQNHARIVVQDDGSGMTVEMVHRAWMNPATPTKFLAKKRGRRLTPLRQRVVQGEKGIGRFAVLKLAKKVSVVTRVRGAAMETVIWYDFTRFDDDFVEENGEEKEIFLDEVEIAWDERPPNTLDRDAHGTIIVMEELKGAWNERVVDRLCRDVANLTDPVSRLTRKEARDNFEISVYCNGEQRFVADTEQETLKALIEDKAVFSIQGRFFSKSCVFRFDKGVGTEEVSLYDEHIRGLWIWRQKYRSEEERLQAAKRQAYTCGDFAFQFYIFDFSRRTEGRYVLTQDEKNRLKSHRIYLYRDRVRVYPYGDPDDDWLNIDIARGIGRAGDFFSNDQIIGWVDISQEENPQLRDKTNREGLIETGGAAEEFVFLIQTFLSYIKQGPFLRYLMRQRKRSEARAIRDGLVHEHLSELRTSLENTGEVTHAKVVSRIESAYEHERNFLTQRAETTEDLAGVGLSVEMASHDIMLLMGRAQEIGLTLAHHARKGSIDAVSEKADTLVGVLQQIVIGMRDVQSLFRSSRRRRKVLKVEPILDKIQRIYAGLLAKLSITYRKSVVGTSPLVASTNDGVVMQVLINLFDNAAYWLETTAPSARREIRVTLDGDAGELTFADSGPGVDPEDVPYIFEAFFSSKGQDGRGLGLYVARRLLERQGYTIEMIEARHAALDGANFRVRFLEDTG